MGNPELIQFFRNGLVTCFDKLSFQILNEKQQTPFTVTSKLNTVHLGVFTYQQNIIDWNTSIANSISRCLDDEIYLIDKYSCSSFLAEICLDYVDRLGRFFSEGHIFHVCILTFFIESNAETSVY